MLGLDRAFPYVSYALLVLIGANASYPTCRDRSGVLSIVDFGLAIVDCSFRKTSSPFFLGRKGLGNGKLPIRSPPTAFFNPQTTI